MECPGHQATDECYYMLSQVPIRWDGSVSRGSTLPCWAVVLPCWEVDEQPAASSQQPAAGNLSRYTHQGTKKPPPPLYLLSVYSQAKLQRRQQVSGPCPCVFVCRDTNQDQVRVLPPVHEPPLVH
jgi:hypothetical protein